MIPRLGNKLYRCEFWIGYFLPIYRIINQIFLRIALFFGNTRILNWNFSKGKCYGYLNRLSNSNDILKDFDFDNPYGGNELVEDLCLLYLSKIHLNKHHHHNFLHLNLILISLFYKFLKLH